MKQDILFHGRRAQLPIDKLTGWTTEAWIDNIRDNPHNVAFIRQRAKEFPEDFFYPMYHSWRRSPSGMLVVGELGVL